MIPQLWDEDEQYHIIIVILIHHAVLEQASLFLHITDGSYDFSKLFGRGMIFFPKFQWWKIESIAN